MRLDKWLKLSRVIKRRTIAQMACDQGRVFVNDRTAKSATTLKQGDRIHIELGSRALTVEVAEIPLKAPPAQDAAKMYRVLEEIRRPREEFTAVDDVDDDW
jgi:ribosomal 50S subunit-recycling heat shock protein